MAAKSAPKKNMSAIKRTRQNEKRKLRGQAIRGSLKTHIKKTESLLTTDNREELNQSLKQAVKTISSAAAKGIIHRNTASRKISKLVRKTNAAKKA